MKSHMAALQSRLTAGFTTRKILLILLGAMICTFGIHNIHQRTHITEGGMIGLMLLVEDVYKRQHFSFPGREKEVWTWISAEKNF